jgi:hypothetical protein
LNAITGIAMATIIAAIIDATVKNKIMRFNSLLLP